MYIGHYGVALAAKRIENRIPLWQLFLAVVFLDVLWSIFNLVGIEHSTINPAGAASKINFDYLAITHGLLTSLGWSVLIYLIFLRVPAPRGAKRQVVALVLGACVWSHFWLDVPFHRGDLPLIGNSYKIGFGLYNNQLLTFGLETLTLLVGMALYLDATRRYALWRRIGIVVFTAVLTGVNALAIFGPAFSSAAGVAIFLESSFWIFAAIAFFLDRAPAADEPAAATPRAEQAAT